MNLGWEELYYLLHESLKLQSHYAALLNMHDGGTRLQFPTVEDWARRNRQIEKDKPIKSNQ